MPVPQFDFDEPDRASDVGPSIDQTRDDTAYLYAGAVAASLGVPLLLGPGQTITSSPADKPTTVELTGLQGGRKIRLTIGYTGDNPTTITVELDSGSGYEAYPTQTNTFDGSGNWTGASTP